jgi:hypothetical protein
MKRFFSRRSLGVGGSFSRRSLGVGGLTTILLAILIFAGNCRKAELSLEGGGSQSTITFSISGRVLDKSNVPVSGAEVKAGGIATTTDVNGNFTLDNVSAKKDAAFVKVEKSGFFTGSRTFVAHARVVNYVDIKLINKEVAGNFSASGGGSVTLPAGGSITFQPNGIADANGAAYSGTVAVSAFFIDPTVQGFTSIMPGDLRGITSSNEERGLESFGMMAVELNASGGQKLQLASGKKATIKFPIPAALVSQAPATIPLWYFDEADGMWKEEGSATKQGNEYIGEVSHFSFWNCDAPFQLVNFEAIVKDQNGNPVVNAEVIIKKISDGSQGCGRTDDAGKVSGKIPANEALQIRIKDRCQNVLHNQNIGPFSSNANLGTITVNVNPTTTLTITGTAVSCTNTPVTNGYVHVLLDGLAYRAPVNNGNFSVTIQRCVSTAANAAVSVTDIGSNQQSASSTFNVTSGTVNAGQVSACGTTISNYINYTIDATQTVLTHPQDSLRITTFSTQQVTTIEGSTRSQPYDYISFSFPGSAPGTYELQSLYAVRNSTTLIKSGAINVNITEFGTGSGSYIAGNFTGNMRDSMSTALHPITCNFRVKRQ